jgi:hypothetical protein
MPTLPERATSILAVLAHNTMEQASPPSAASSFDWQTLVAEKKPGSKTESQRQQALRVRGILSDLQAWAQQRGLPSEHVEESAFYAVVSTHPATPDSRALVLATVVFWIYLLDDFLDRRDIASLVSSAPGGVGLAELDRDLGTILAPLEFDRAAVSLWRERPPQHRPLAGNADSRPSPDAQRLARTLMDILAALEAEWAHMPGAWRWRRVRRALVARHFAACAVAMRQELLWNAAFARERGGRALPTFKAYLRNGTVSIGMPAVAAVAASFEPHPRRTWRRAHALIAAGGDVVRLTNDLHTYYADIAEGKVTSITIRRWALANATDSEDAQHAPLDWGAETSPEVRAAQASLSADLARAAAAFGQAQAGVSDGPLAYCARHAVAFALAVYGDGSQYRERAA